MNAISVLLFQFVLTAVSGVGVSGLGIYMSLKFPGWVRTVGLIVLVVGGGLLLHAGQKLIGFFGGCCSLSS